MPIQLRGQVGGRCPECDATITLGIKTPDLVLRWFVASLIALCLALGFDGVVSCVLLIGSLFFGLAPAQLLLFFLPASVILAGCLTALLHGRVGFQRMSTQSQGSVTIFLWVVLFLIHLAYLGWLAAS